MNYTIEKKPTVGTDYKVIAELATELSKEVLGSNRYGQSVKVVPDGEIGSAATKLRSGLAKHGRFNVSVVEGALWVTVNSTPRSHKKKAAGRAVKTLVNRKPQTPAVEAVN